MLQIPGIITNAQIYQHEEGKVYVGVDDDDLIYRWRNKGAD